MGAVPEGVTILVAAVSGSVANIIHPDGLPAGCVHSGANAQHFAGFGGEHIERFSEVDIATTCSHRRGACCWECADMTRALHSISKVTGPESGPGVHEVLFTNEARRLGLAEVLWRRSSNALP